MDQLTDFSQITLLNILTIIGCYECIFIGFYLLLKKSVRYQANRYLGGLLLAPATVLFPSFMFQIGLLDKFPHIIHIHFFTYLLFGPLAYFYVRACTQKDFKMKPLLLLHFIPALIALIYFLPFYIQPGAEKVAAYILFREEGTLGAPTWIMVLRMFHIVTYFIICIRLVFVYRKHLENATSYIDVTFHRWLIFFSAILLLPMFGAVFMILTSYQRPVANVIFGIILLFAMSIRLAMLIRPSLFHVFPHQMLIPDSTEEQKQRYEKSTLQEDSKEHYVKRLVLFMDMEKPYLSTDLTLAELSKQTNIPTHHLSQIINEKLECNFLDYINQYRVKEAQKMLLDPKLNHYTIVSIAYEAGFNSKSTFYTAFKKNTTMTPSQYKKQELKKATTT